MAADKAQRTEKPTAKARKEAKRQGRFARSPEVSSWLSLLGMLLVLPSLGTRAVHSVTNLTAEATQAMAAPDTGKALSLFESGLSTILSVALPFLAVATVLGVAANLAQVGFHLSPGALGFKWSKISPKHGITRILSPNGLWELVKNFARLALLAVVGFTVAHKLIDSLLLSGTLAVGTTMAVAWSGISSLLRDVGVVALMFGLADYAFQRHRTANAMKMTREEVKREAKENEGNPEVRRVMRQRRRALTRMQVIAAVTNADVVVVNPTHYAVGLAYDRATHRAPKLLAKGDDEIAAAIRFEALARHVPIVESPALARALYASCEVGDEIPPALYEVVAKLFAFVYRLSPAARALVDVHHLASNVPLSVP